MRRMLTAWPVLLLVFGGCGGNKGLDKDEAAKPATTQVEKASADQSLVELDAAAQQRAGIRTQILAMKNVAPEIVAYGRLEEDTAGSFALRAPISGTLRVATGRAWPRIGEHLELGRIVGLIEPRFTPTERVGFNTQLTAARSELSGSTASISAARAAYERARLLNADNKNVADRVVQETEAHLRSEEARAKSAAATVEVLEASLTSAGVSAPRTLSTERDGDVAEVLAQPGESVEPGVPILRIARLDILLARIDVPVGDPVAPNLVNARIVPAGHEEQPPLNAERVAVSAAIDPRAQGVSLLFRLLGTRFGLRPGLAVTAYLPTAAVGRSGIVIPQAAVVRTGGKAYVYLQTGSSKFERRQVPLDQPTTEGYIVTSGFAAGDYIVTTGAQSLLSEEFKSQLKEDEP
jgi:RND family efflux transporter MFP subunit